MQTFRIIIKDFLFEEVQNENNQDSPQIGTYPHFTTNPTPNTIYAVELVPLNHGRYPIEFGLNEVVGYHPRNGHAEGEEPIAEVQTQRLFNPDLQAPIVADNAPQDEVTNHQIEAALLAPSRPITDTYPQPPIPTSSVEVLDGVSLLVSDQGPLSTEVAPLRVRLPEQPDRQAGHFVDDNDDALKLVVPKPK